ncbi:MAG: ribosome biogenesis GTPase Der [Patescibacteria group bacterium]
MEKKKEKRRLPLVVIVGRANVGKSTLWNRLSQTGRALVSDIAHTTRDRNYSEVVWRGSLFDVVDTGGLDAEQGSEIGRGILKQAELAIREADLILFLVDAKTGILAQDRDLAKSVKKINQHIVPVVNKTDNARDLHVSSTKEVWGLGLGDPVNCSASTGRGTGELLDRIFEELHRIGKPPIPIDIISGKPLKVVIMGRPNVGKSSLTNSILGKERSIVSSVAHTTREPVDTELVWKGERLILVDTAGMRKRAHIEKGLEEAGLEKNREALKKADVAVLVLDSTEGVYDQDKHLAGLLKDENKGLIIVMNKWDLVEGKTHDTVKYFEAHVRHALPFLKWAPIIFTSAKNNLRAAAILDAAFKVREERRRQIAYNALQRFLKMIITKKRPFQESGPQSPYVHDIAQIGVEPPTFVVTVRGLKATIHEAWLRFFENRLREKFGFSGTPIKVIARSEPVIKAEMPEHIRNRPTRRKRPIGRRAGRY